MADTLHLLLLSAFLCAAVAAQQRHSNISLGSSLTPTANSSWLSPSGLYAFGFYRLGNGSAVGVFLAGIQEKIVVWTANRDNPPVPSSVTLLLTADGRLILQPTQGQEINIASPSLSQSASSASMLDSGNFVLYNSDQQIIWRSFEHPTDTLLPGQNLANRANLFSSISETDHSTGAFRLNMQGDGNLVLYPVETPRGTAVSDAYWASVTDGKGDKVTLNLEDDGHLYLFNSSSNILNLTVGGYPKERTFYLMRLDVGGIFRLYSHNLDQKGNWSIVWSPNSIDECSPKGLCGINGFCFLMDDRAECMCLPGFDFVNPERWSSGCERNYTAGSCKNNDTSIVYSMIALSSTVWENGPYSVFKAITKEDCATACLEDCNCEAALFKDRSCQKQRLPLRPGRRLPGESNVAFVKVGTRTPIVEGVPADLPKENKKQLRVHILIISVSLVAFAFIVLSISGVLIYRNKVWAYRKISEKANVELSEDVGPKAFTYAELERVTNGFKEEEGRGSFGTVYKGTVLNNKKVVAVKRLEKVLAEGEREFQTEMNPSSQPSQTARLLP